MSHFTYTGAKRNTISFPLGGIGTGSIGLSGTGRLIDWEIFNRPAKGSINGFSHFAIKASENGHCIAARVLNADLQPPYMGNAQGGSFGSGGFGYGVERATMSGMPHFPDCTFTGKYPFASIEFLDEAFPCKVTMRAFNPFIPTNEDDSSIPAAFFAFDIQNTTDRRLDYTLAGSLCNPFSAQIGENLVEQDGSIHALRLLDRTHDAADAAYGDITLATDAEQVSWQSYWYRGMWFDSLSVFWTDFTRVEQLPERLYPVDASRTNNGNQDTGTLAAHLSLAPGETRTVRFVIAWNMPNNENYWSPNDEKGERKKGWKNWYATKFADSMASASYALRSWNRLKEQTWLFADALFSSTMPEAALDAISATMSVLKTATTLRLEDGSLYGWEGCGPTSGSCEGSCSHVWAYTYALPFLFPRLERSMRDIEYKYTMDEHGGLHFRVMLPLGSKYWSFRPCADGQFATVFKTYRDYLLCGDKDWLRLHFADVEKAIAYAWSEGNVDRWDPEQSGVLTGRQHHTLDMELFGPKSWLNSMYLCALRAGEEMAKVLGKEALAAQYRSIFEKGKAWSDEHLFNGEYYQQNVDLHDKELIERFDRGTGDALTGSSAVAAYWNDENGEMKYQVGEGCSIDQVLGQWHADMIGLGDVLDREQVRSALHAIFHHNYLSMRNHANPCRIFALNDENGTLICSYPQGREKPVIPVPYAEETMHGFEYQAAVHMISQGMLEEGMTMIQAVRDRYDGERRNPWNEIECGSNYARSMAVFALLPVFSGMRYDLGRGMLGFVPLLPGNGRWFWSVDSGFGTVEYKDGQVALSVLYGELTLRELQLRDHAYTGAELDGKAAAFCAEKGMLYFAEPICIKQGEELRIE